MQLASKTFALIRQDQTLNLSTESLLQQIWLLWFINYRPTCTTVVDV